MATLLDEQLELDDDTLAALEAAQAEYAEPEQTPPTPAAQDVDNGARPANAPAAIKQQAQAQQPAVKADDAENKAALMTFRGALDEARQRRLGASIGQAADEFSSRLLGQQASPYWQRAMQEADEPVRQFQAIEGMRERQEAAKLKARAQETAHTNALTAQTNAATAAAGRGVTMEYQREQIEAGRARRAREAARDDATSDESKKEQTLFAALAPDKAKMLGPALSQMSATQLDKIGKYAALDNTRFSQAMALMGFDLQKMRFAADEAERARKAEAEKAKAAGKQTEDEAKYRVVDMVRMPGAPDLSETELKDVRNAKVGYENLQRELATAKQLLTNHGREVLVPGTHGYGLWNSLRGRVDAAYKEQKALGSLDDGVTRLVNAIVGGKWDIATGNMPALIDENLKANTADFITKARNKGYVFPATYKPPGVVGGAPNAPRPPALPKGVTLPPGAKVDSQKGTVTMYSGTQPVTVPLGEIKEAVADHGLTYEPKAAP